MGIAASQRRLGNVELTDEQIQNRKGGRRQAVQHSSTRAHEPGLPLAHGVWHGRAIVPQCYSIYFPRDLSFPVAQSTAVHIGLH